MIQLSLLLAIVGLAVLANWVEQKWDRVCFWLAIVGLLLLLFQESYRGWLIPGTLLVCLLVEALWTRRWSHWFSKPNAQETLNSLGFLSLELLLLLGVMALGLGELIANFPPEKVSWGLDARGTSFWLQLVVMMVLADLKDYWFHRFNHASVFWNFHKLHHEPTSVNCITGHLEYPTVIVLNTLANLAIAYLAGISFQVVAIERVVNVVIVGYIAHLNLGFPNMEHKFPWFAYLIATPNYHGWHHTVHCRPGYSLAAGYFPFWDVLFGTFEKPYGNRRNWQFGVEESEKLPPTMLGKILVPLGRLKTFLTKNTVGIDAEYSG